MKAFVFPLLLGVCLCFSSCGFLLNTALYGTNCETCRVVDCFDDMLWCDTECYTYEAKERMRARANAISECYPNSWVTCSRGED